MKSGTSPSHSKRTAAKPRPRGRPRGPDYGLDPFLQRRLRRQRAADRAATAAKQADLEARFFVLCNGIAEEGWKVAEALDRVGLTWPQLHLFLRRHPYAAAIYRDCVAVRDDERESHTYRRILGNSCKFRRQFKCGTFKLQTMEMRPGGLGRRFRACAGGGGCVSCGRFY